jgi:superkiller protein 3
VAPQNVAAHLELGQLYAETQEYENAIKEFNTVLELEPDNLFSRIYLGRIYTTLKDYDHAAKEFNTILNRNPNNFYAHINLGKMYVEMKDYDHAIAEFKKVIELNPKDYMSYFILGELLSDKKGKPQEAISCLSKGLSLNPNHFDSQVRLGNLYLKTGKIRNAIPHLELALRLNPKAPGLKEKIADLKKRL